MQVLGQKQTVNCALKVAQARQTIEIIAVAPLINPENQNTSTNLNAPALENLPNPGGDLTYPLHFAPGALINTAGSSNDFVGGTNGFRNVEINGLPALSNGYIVDELESNDPLAASTALEALSTEADRERKISHFQLRRLLGFQALIEVDAFLKDCGVELEYAAEDLERDRETLEQFGCGRA